MNTVKKILNIASKVATWLLVAFTVFMTIFTIVTVTTVDKNERDVFGYRFYIVKTDSMSKSDKNAHLDVHFNAGDIVIIKTANDPTKLQAGDIIAFMSTNSVSYGETVTHMIREVKTNSDGKVIGYVTYGTNTGVDDETLVEPAYVFGSYSGKLPGVGIGFKKCAIISSYAPQAGDLRTDTVSDDEETETFEKYEIYQKMLGGQSVEDFEKEAKRKFINEPANMKLLIVVDKLLTGFDAPPCTYLYIDKAMHDHGLFQAICRVNRLDGDSKDFGYIVDYKQLFGDLADAINTYTAGAFENYDPEDIAGLIKDRSDEAKKYFLDNLEALDELCEGVEMPREELDYIHYFCGENGIDLDNDEAFAQSREKLYKLVSRLIRAFAEFKPRMDDASIPSSEQAKLEERVNMYIKLRDVIGRASGDFLDLKQFEPGMRYLIDNYIVADDAEKVAMFDDFTLLDFILAKQENLTQEDKPKEQASAAEAIENNIRKKVVQKIVINPAYYHKMSEVLEQLILDRKRGVITYKQLLERYLELAKDVNTPAENSRYPESIRKSGAMRAFYDNCGENEKLAIRLHKAVISSKLNGFRNNPTKENRIKRALYQILKDDEMVERLYKIVVEQEEY